MQSDAPETELRLRVQASDATTTVSMTTGRKKVTVVECVRNDEFAELVYGWMAQIQSQQRKEVLEHLIKVYLL